MSTVAVPLRLPVPTGPARRRAFAAVGAASALLLAVGLAALASVPTGAARVSGVLPGDARVAVQERIGAVQVLVASRPAGLVLVVAHHEAKGWFGTEAARVPARTPAAWAQTPGAGPVPALSAVYGRAAAGVRLVRVQWSDGAVTERAPASDGTYLAARPGRTGAGVVRFLDASGAVVSEVTGL